MYKLILSFLFFQCITLIGISQQTNKLSGKVIDDHSKPLQHASVYLLNSGSSVLTDSAGSFQFTNILPGKYAVEISATGFASVVKEVSTGSSNVLIQMVRTTVQLDEVIVTAQKKDELLRKLPFSISALSAKETEAYRLWNSRDLAALVPNLFSANPGDERNVTSIRGITSTSYDPAVSTYIDAVSQFSLDTYIQQLFDIERIEILRGPQSTLYGRNAMGGVINIITKAPGNSVNGFAETSIGNYGTQRYAAGIRLPVVKNKLFAGASFLYNSLNGFYTNEFNDSHFDKKHNLTGNYYLKYTASPRLYFSLNMKHNINRNKGAFPLVMGITEAVDNPFRLNQNAVALMKDNTTNYSLTAKYSGHKINLLSQTAFQENYRYYTSPIDGDFSPIDGITIINDYGKGNNTVKVWTQEFRFTPSPNADLPWNWTGGVYLFNQHISNKQATHFGENADMMGAPDKNFSILNTTGNHNYGIALYGQLTREIISRLYVTAGLRYDYEYKQQRVLGEFLRDPDPVPQFETRPDTVAGNHFTALSPKLSLAYQLTDNNQYYISYNRGYRTGGFTSISSDPSLPPLYGYKPEYSNNYEAGTKHTMMKRRIQLNAALFYTSVNNAQVPSLILPDALTITKNAGKLISKGAELEFISKPAKGFELDYNFGYTHATYKFLKLPHNGTEQDYSGNRQIFTPVFTSALVSQYSFNLKHNPAVKFSIRGEWLGVGDHYFDLQNTVKQKGYSLFNARITGEVKGISIAVWARNVTDKKYIRYAYDFGAVHLGEPFTYGVTVKAQF